VAAARLDIAAAHRGQQNVDVAACLVERESDESIRGPSLSPRRLCIVFEQ